jgi:flagellar basal body P-ring formation protein FlgA
MSRNRARFAALFRPRAAPALPTLAAVNLPSFPLLLALALPAAAWAQAVPQAAVPQASITQALALVSEAAAALAPAGARVKALPGTLDSRLRLAPCARTGAFLVPGAAASGRTRVGLRCEQGPARWTVYLPVTVQVWAPALVPTAAMAVGARLEAEQLKMAEVDWAAAPQPPFADTAALAGRVLARGVPAGQALRTPDLQARLWFAAGDPVRVVTNGPGFAISTDGQAVSAGIEGQRVRVRIGENRVVEGRAVAHRLVEVGP